jgi:endonuclease YncB( thermonuclease family)
MVSLKRNANTISLHGWQAERALKARKLRGDRRKVALFQLASAVAVVGLFALAGYSFFVREPRPAGITEVNLGIDICSFQRATCLVDGDTGWQDGRKWRMLAIDTPEVADKAECARERELAIVARDRLQALMGNGYSINWLGRDDRYGRALVNVILANGQDAGNVLLQEGLAQPWPNYSNPWCQS